jgi:hypothetical protein
LDLEEDNFSEDLFDVPSLFSGDQDFMKFDDHIRKDWQSAPASYKGGNNYVDLAPCCPKFEFPEVKEQGRHQFFNRFFSIPLPLKF